MKVPINWLKEFIEIPFSSQELAEKLLQLGIEVERIEESSTLKGIKIGKVLSVKKHPSADKLTICMVDVGEDSIKQIICGASNIKEAIKVPVILPGNTLPNGLKIEKRALRGVESEGMICSKTELELEDNSQGIWILPDKCKAGNELTDEIQTDDAVIDIKITPNRGDCLSIMGIARELAALTSQKLKLPKIVIKETKEKIKDKIEIKVEDSGLCPRYTARMAEGVHIKESPHWIRRRLILSGVRPINNIVDITNYVMLETGQPLHAFDYEKITDKKIIVRKAQKNEKILCLDGIQRALSFNVPNLCSLRSRRESRLDLGQALVIADSKKPIALAGIMGGEEAGVNKNTKNILLESANFSSTLIRKTSKSLNIASESSYRFERGVDWEGTEFAVNRVCSLIQELSGAEIVSGIVDIKKTIAKKTISFNPSEIKRVLGIEIPSYNKILQELGFETNPVRNKTPKASALHLERISNGTKKDGSCLKVQVPSWRNDIEEEIDLIEEIARINNYDLIPLSLPLGRMPSLKEDNKEKIIKKCRSILNRFSLNEVVNYSFISADLLKKSAMGMMDETIKIDNPISEEFEILRYSLIPSLLQVAQENISRGEKDIKVFELCNIHKYGKNKLPEENIRLGILLTGDWQQPNWINSGVKSSFYMLKGVIETFFKELGIKLDYNKDKHSVFGETYTFSLLKDNVKVGVIGEANSMLMDNFLLKEKTYIAEIDMELLLPFVRLKKKIEAVPKYPPVVRDVSFIVPDDISSDRIENIMSQEAKELLENIKLFDYYKGKQVPGGFKSMSYSLCFRSNKKTLTDEEINQLQDKIIKKLEELGLKLRS
ncbi:phenylalanine--tRNA ligase subunit beta [bacterium]|nr:phenylalanine--tRNA ligase subunit beta [bacterium]